MESRRGEPSGAEEVKPQLSEAERLREQYGSIPDADFELYDEQEKRDEFRSEAESVCREAFVYNSDIILFFDQGARGLGLLTHKLLPIIRLEYAKHSGQPLEEVKIPEVKFFDPHMRELVANPDKPIITDAADEALGKEIDEKLRSGIRDYQHELVEKLGKYFESKKVLLCDESSGQGEERSIIYKKEPEEQYTLLNSEDFAKFRQDRYRARSGMMRRSIAQRFIDLFPNSQFEVSSAGNQNWGLDKFRDDSEAAYGVREKKKFEQTYRRAAYIKHPLYGYMQRNEAHAYYPDATVEVYSPFVEPADPSDEELAGFIDYRVQNNEKYQDLNTIRQRIRLEHSMIAKEALERVLGNASG